MSRPLKILIFVSRRDKPSTRLRICAYLPYFAADNIHCEIIETSKHTLKRIKGILGSGQYDVCIIQKKLLSQTELFLLSKMTSRLIFDIDDAIIFDDHGDLKPSANARFAYACRISKGIIAGNNYLASLAEPYCKNICVIPTPIDIQNIPLQCRPERPVRTIGWLGSPATAEYLIKNTEILNSLVNIHGFKFKFISSAPVKLPFPYDFLQWDACKESDYLNQMDIALSPLPDNAFTRGKCGYKIIQYQANGVPTIASNVGFNKELIRHLDTGFLAESASDWINSALKCKEDHSLYESIRTKARRQIETTYDIRITYEQFKTFIFKMMDN